MGADFVVVLGALTPEVEAKLSGSFDLDAQDDGTTTASFRSRSLYALFGKWGKPVFTDDAPDGAMFSGEDIADLGNRLARLCDNTKTNLFRLCGGGRGGGVLPVYDVALGGWLFLRDEGGILPHGVVPLSQVQAVRDLFLHPAVREAYVCG